MLPAINSNSQANDHCPAAAELYRSGYRAKRTGERTGAVRDSDGKIYLLNIYTGYCTCRPRTHSGTSVCIHVLRFTALRCYHLAARIARQQARTSSESVPTQETVRRLN